MKRFLVPTDFSDTAGKAYRFALNIAGKVGGTVILYHVYTPIDSPMVDTEEVREDFNGEMILKAQSKLDKLASQANGADVKTVMERSPLIDHILDYSEKNEIDMIVMGTQGAEGLKKVIIGSNSGRIAERCKIPLLLVPEEFDGQSPKHIAFAADCRDSDKKALDTLVPFAKLYDAEITVVHLYETDSDPEEQEAVKFDKYECDLKNEYSHLQFRLLKTERITRTLEHLEDSIPYDLVVMTRRKRNFLERFFLDSFTRKMSYVTKHPLLIIPEA